MRWLVSTALRFRLLVLAGAVALVVGGIRLAGTAALDVFPEFARPTVEVQTEAPGLSSEEVESLVTLPLENALHGTPWLKTLRSKSVLGLSSVVLEFEDGTDLLRARQLVQERVGLEARRLPSVAGAPVILQPLSSTSRALKIGLWSSSLSILELSETARWVIRPRLMAVPGVANVAMWGQRDRQLQVLVDPDRLRAHGVGLEEVETAAAQAVAPEGGGFLDSPNQRLAVRHRPAVRTAGELAGVPVAYRTGSPLLLGQVARVVEGAPPAIGDAVIGGGEGLLLIVEKHPWGNTLAVTRGVEEALEALRPALHGVEIDSTIFRPATFIERSLENLERALLQGSLLVAVVLLFFLHDLRTSLISMAAIPLSLLAALAVLRALDQPINTMVLAGLVIAAGEVVDDAIIDVENIARRLKLNREAGSPLSTFQVVLRASLEVRSAVVFASWIVVLVFLPVLFLEGLAGSFFRPLAFSYILAVLASLLVALTVTPALSLVLLGRGAGRRGDPPLLRLLKAGYRRVLPPLIRRPRWAAVVLLVAFAAAAVGAVGLEEEFLPDFQETDFLMHWVGRPGTSLEAMRRTTVRVSEELRSIPGVRNFGAHIGRAEVADEVVGPNFAELWISVDRQADHAATVRRIQEVVDGYPGVYRDVLTYLKERIKEVLTGAGATVVVRIFGPELPVLREKAEEAARALAGVEGVVDLRVEPQVLVPQVEVQVDAARAAAHGLTPGQVRAAATALVRGKKVGEAYTGQRIHDVVVWGEEAARSDLEALRRLPLAAPSGALVPLGEVARVAVAPAPNEIKREAASRRLDVTFNVRGRALGEVAREAAARVREISFPAGYHPEILGEYAAREESRRRLLGLSAAALVAILLLLQTDFRSLRLTLLVCLTLPFALVGGVLGAYLGGAVLSLGSLVGFVTVLGIAARNGILLVSHWRHLEEEEDRAFGLPLILQGAEERLSPILMTALCAALALLPLALAGKAPGHEIEHPMALVILGGLASSTLLNLFLLPALYGWVGRGRARAAAPAGEEG